MILRAPGPADGGEAFFETINLGPLAIVPAWISWGQIQEGRKMDTSVLYNVLPQEAFGTLIAVYFYLTGLSAGSFVLSTLAFVFGMEKYKPIGKIGVVLAA